MNYGIDINCELDFISQQLLIQLNDIIACIQGQASTLANDIKNFRKLHDTLHDIRYVKASNSSVKIRKELKDIQGYLMINIRQMRNQHKKRLAYFYQKQREMELAHPQVETLQKVKLRNYSSRTASFIQQMELLLN